MCVLSVSLAVMQQSAAEKERGRSGQFGKRKLHHFPSFSWTRVNLCSAENSFTSSQVNSVEVSFTDREIFVRGLDNASFNVTRIRLFSLALSQHAYRQTPLCVFDFVHNHLYSVRQYHIVCTPLEHHRPHEILK